MSSSKAPAAVAPPRSDRSPWNWLLVVPVVVPLLVVAVVVTAVQRAMEVGDGVDGTAETDHTAEREDPTVRDLPDPLPDEPLADRAPAPGR